VAEPTLQAISQEGRIDVLVDGTLFTSYRTPGDWKFPYFWPVNSPGTGESLTVEKGVNYPHHRSLYFACDKVGGGDYWQEGLERGRVVSSGTLILETGKRVVIKDSCDWVREDAPSPIHDHRRITITAPSPEKWLIEFEINLTFLIDTHIEKSNHSLFAAEMSPDLSVEGGGRIINSSGRINEEQTFGEKAEWCDYSGERKGVRQGLAILQHPQNPGYPWPFFTRNYGFFSPTPMNWLDEKGLDYKAGDRVQLKFLVVAHKGGTEEAGLDQVFSDWTR
jgi:hypothetical protein